MNKNSIRSIVPNVGKILADALATKSQIKNRKRRGPRRAAPKRSGQYTAALPAAYTTHVQPRFSIESRTADTCIVSGTDLVYSIPATVLDDDNTLFSLFPANPAYWTGTKISQIAPAYMTYRPLAFRVSYIPQVAVTQQGTVFMGTLWNGAAPSDNIQQSLFTSNGGLLTQCYVPADRTVSLGRNLQQNLFTMNDSLNPDTCPFLYMAGVRGASVVPGYFYVSYRYEFRNPLGSAWLYATTPGLTVADLPGIPRYANMSIVLMEAAAGFGPGTIMDYERDGTITYHNTAVSLASNVSIILFANQQSSLTAQSVDDRTVGAVTIAGVSFNLSEAVLEPAGTPITTTGANYMVPYIGASGDPQNGLAYLSLVFSKDGVASATPQSPYYRFPERQVSVPAGSPRLIMVSRTGRTLFTATNAGSIQIPWASLPLLAL